MNPGNALTRFTHGGACHQYPGGVPETDTRGASPHALPFAPTRPNGTGHHLRAILWGLGRTFTPNPSTFTSQHWKALRDAFIRVGGKARLRHLRPWRYVRSAARQSKASVTPPVGGCRPCADAVRTVYGHVWMESLRCRSNGFMASRHTPDHAVGGWFEKKIRPPTNGVLSLGFGEFPTQSLWKTQVRGNKLCEGIVGVTASLASNCHTIFWILACHGVSRARTRLTLPKPNKCSM